MNRLILPKLVVLVVLVALVGRLYRLQLVTDEADYFRATARARTTQYLPVRPIRGEVLASDGQTLLAESVPIYTVSIRPADLPSATLHPYQRAEVFAQLSQLLGISTTLTISPALVLSQDPVLRNDLSQGLGVDLSTAIMTGGQTTIAVPAAKAIPALKLSVAYSTTLRLANPIAERIDHTDIPGYQTLTIKPDISRDVAMVLQENATSLPGVVVEQDYRRRYPLSAEIQSFSHLLGFIGRVDECDLVRQNEVRSWVSSLLESIGHAEECGIVKKQIRPEQLGIPRYLGDDRIGKDGIEASYENELRGQLGWQALLVDAASRPVRAPQVVQPAHDGSNLVLTIDVGFQRQVEHILRNWIDVGEQRRQTQTGAFAYKRDYKPIRSGVAIVMEVHTGRILAMASWPAYDNNIWDPSHAANLERQFYPSDPAAQKELLRLTPLLNRAIALQYPPGSTLKQFDASIALHEGIITPETKVHDIGKLVLEDQFGSGQTFTYPNAGNRPYGDITVSDALKVSSNVFFMSVIGGNKDRVINLKDEEKNIESGLRIEKFAKGLNWFGLGERTGVRLAGEQPGRVPTPAWMQKVLRQAWTTGDTYNAAIGQGNLEVTPLQLIAGAVAIANNGSLYRPQIVRAITDSSGQTVKEVEPELIRQIPVDPRYLAVVREGMRRSVTEGVDIAARDICSGLSIAGKTGTAEFGPLLTIPTADGKGSRQVRQSHSWFVGFAPYDNPQIEVLALVEGTGDLGDGSATIAVPAVTQIMQVYFKITPPNPLPRGCQMDLPPLPPRIEPGAPATAPAEEGPWQ